MAENLEMLEAMQTEANTEPESDQQAEVDAVSLDELNGEAEDLTETGEAATGAEESEGAADPQPEDEEKPTLTQSAFDRAFGERANGLRKQFQREHHDDLMLADAVRKAYPGMTVDEIADELLTEQAKALAEETGWTQDEAKAKLKARRQFESTGKTGEPEVDPHVEMLGKQLEEIRKREGINMLEIAQNDPYLTEQINSGAMDFKDALLYYYRNRTASEQRPRTAPRVEKRASVAGANTAHEWNDKEIERADAALKAGRKVRL